MRLMLWLLMAAAAGLLGVHLWQGLFHGADPDEFQTLVNAVSASRGMALYADFWDNHGPLMTWILSPVAGFWNGGHELLYGLRLGQWLITVAIAALVFCAIRSLLAGRSADWARVAPWTGVVMLLAAPPFLAKSIEVRPDNLANCCATVVLVCMLHGLRRERTWPFVVAGAALGIMAGLTLKVGVFGVGLAFFLVGYGIIAHGKMRIRDIMLVAGMAGFVSGLLFLLVVFQGSWQEFLHCYLWENVHREFPGFTSSRLTQITKTAPVWSAWALAVLGWGCWRILRRRAEPVEAGLTLMVLAIVLQFWLVLPTKYYQSLLYAFPPLAILTGLWAEAVLPGMLWLKYRARVVAAVGFSVICLLVRDMDDFANLRNRSLPNQIVFADAAMERLGTGQTLFDPTGIVFLAHRTGYYPVLVKFVRRQYRAGGLDPGVGLQINSAAAVIFDKRTRDLPANDLERIGRGFRMAMRGPAAELWVRK